MSEATLTLRKRLSRFAWRFGRVASRWLFEDVLYAALPILILALMRMLLDDTFREFFLLKEWSFASVVISGATIRRMMNVKANIERDTTSDDYNLALQAPILALILSVVVLALVALFEMQRISVSNSFALQVFQVTTFVLALALYLVAVRSEIREETRASDLPLDISRVWLLEHMIYLAEQSHGQLLTLKLQADRAAGEGFDIPEHPGRSSEWEKLIVTKLAAATAQTKALADAIYSRVASYPDVTTLDSVTTET